MVDARQRSGRLPGGAHGYVAETGGGSVGEELLLVAWAGSTWSNVGFAPLTVVEDGKVDLPTGLSGPHLTPDELTSALRVRGAPGPEEVERAVLEPAGEISIVGRSDTEAPGSPDQ